MVPSKHASTNLILLQVQMWLFFLQVCLVMQVLSDWTMSRAQMKPEAEPQGQLALAKNNPDGPQTF